MRIKSIFSILLSFLLAAALLTACIDQRRGKVRHHKATKLDSVAEMKGYHILAVKLDSLSAETKPALAGAFLAWRDVADEGDVKIVRDTPKLGPFSVLDMEARGYRDDSISGENFRLIVYRKDDLFYLRSAGVQYICARGINKGKPQTGLCP